MLTSRVPWGKYLAPPGSGVFFEEGLGVLLFRPPLPEAKHARTDTYKASTGGEGGWHGT